MKIEWGKGIIIFIIFSFIMGCISMVVVTIIFFANDIKIENYCESLGYDYADIVRDKFNCCSDEIEEGVGEDGYFYREVPKCVAGGVYPVK